jgi:hypothetical protein
VDAGAPMPLDAVDAPRREVSMIVNFSTRFDRLTMFAEPARALLALMGHSGSIPGAILAADLPAVLRQLRLGLEQSGHVPSPAPLTAPGADDDDRPRERPVDLATRAVPLIAMIERAVGGGSDLMWDRG